MTTDLFDLVQKLKRETKWQRTPQPISDEDYLEMAIDGIRYFHMLTNQSSVDVDGLADRVAGTFPKTFNLTEMEIVMCAAQIKFYEQVRADKNAIVGFTTDAITVTNADKPYQYLTSTIEELRRSIRIAYYKLTSVVFE